MLSWPRFSSAFDFAQAARTATLTRVDTVILLASLGAVLGIRLQLLLGTDFPINDGALFLAFVEAIAREFPHLPATVAYNGDTIPFAYPPLSFWLGAAGVRLGLPALDIVHAAPILMNMVYVLLFAVLLLRTGHSHLFAAVAVLVFGTTFRSYQWLVMGGGLSRGLGSLFLLLTLLALLPPGLWRDKGWAWRRLVVAGLCIGGTLLSHLEWGMLATFSALVGLALARPRFRDWFIGAAVMGAVAFALVAPWFVWVVLEHGMAPFEAASKTSAWRLRVLPEGARMVMRNAANLLPFALLGIVLVLRSRDVFWLVFTLASALLIPRSGETPLVLGIGVLAATGLLGAITAAGRSRSRWARPAALTLVIAGVLLTALRVQGALKRDERFVALPRDENFVALSREVRGAMAWVAEHQPGRRFAVLREAPWYYNASAEWFPVLARSVSTTTVQGREWLPDLSFDRMYLAVEALNNSTTCEELDGSLAMLQPSDLVWVEGIDLDARAAALAAERERKGLLYRLDNLGRRLRGEQRPDPRQGKAGALRGSGTAAGCFDAWGWQEVHANARVRIFQPRR
ncbi:MAG: hypothetical protein AVDCRST_MAG51-3316 [uncultured Ramlibacter sp.]|uniref:Glycosyltransferase RgtA/B/C/D-like domain-containing protein n=1 Tax=uncultured Ramlibacter sp. TaxID=260755 RepID=A0A6J4QE70_9BURK|nr:MAG: hypothetical protein AVDCRST_MAG51-3316 [uncultured Ramlibacter sp.]